MMLRDFDIKIDQNPVVHLFSAEFKDCKTSLVQLGRSNVTEVVNEAGEYAVTVRSRKDSGYGSYDTVFHDTKSGIRCITSPLIDDSAKEARSEYIRTSWKLRMPLVQVNDGLRDAQRGAVLGIFSHWTRSDSPATVVMPTGTGKTETLLATIAALAPGCALVIVPTDPLRSQFFGKALTWGRLRALGVLESQSQYPVVGMFRSGFKGMESLESFLGYCHIVVATMPLLAQMQPEALDVIRRCCALVAVDEAHHLSAPSWSRVVNDFKSSRVLQFTATPFRQDGRHIGGEIIYTYPLARCQAEGFFRPIDFLPVNEYFDEKADRRICDVAVNRLRQDIASGYQHALMARTSSKERARKVFALYQDRHPDLKPVMIYSGMAAADKETAKLSLLNGQSRVVVCVDMLGEGFDYPPLKVAAIHDPHKSLPITLQFVGRFTRSGDHTIGDASIVANIADPKMRANVSSLYSQDADWDSIIRGSYESAIGHEIEFQKFINDFVFDGIKGFSLRNIRPKYSAFVYSVAGDVDLEMLKKGYNDGTNYRLAINQVSGVAVIVHKQNLAVEWGRIIELQNTNYHCYCLFHDEKNRLLFIFSSGGEIPDQMAATVARASTRVTDRRIHRCLHGINRLMLIM